MMMVCNDDATLQGLRVLVVDDDVDSCDMITLMLESYAAESQAVFSASQALEVFVQFQPDVLISDIAMPGEDGYSLLNKLKTLKAERDETVPVIAVSAMATEEERKRALSAGFHTWISKPLDIDELIGAIASLTGRI